MLVFSFSVPIQILQFNIFSHHTVSFFHPSSSLPILSHQHWKPEVGAAVCEQSAEWTHIHFCLHVCVNVLYLLLTFNLFFSSFNIFLTVIRVFSAVQLVFSSPITPFTVKQLKMKNVLCSVWNVQSNTRGGDRHLLLNLLLHVVKENSF